MKIFLSYRREDSAAITGRIYDRLSQQFGRESVFMDVDAIPLGVDFRHHIREAVSQCQVLLAVIGPSWNGVGNNQQRRLDNSGDFVRIELETAIVKGIPIIPLLAGQTPMPQTHELPESPAELTYRNAAIVDVGRDFHPHMDRLIRHLATLAPNPESGASVDVPHSGFPEWRATGSGPPLQAYIALALEMPDGKITSHMFDASQDRRIILGRAPSCDVCLPSALISRKHAMILYDFNRGWVLQDLQSRGGVFLNGERAHDVVLQTGDQVKIASILIHVKMVFQKDP